MPCSASSKEKFEKGREERLAGGPVNKNYIYLRFCLVHDDLDSSRETGIIKRGAGSVDFVIFCGSMSSKPQDARAPAWRCLVRPMVCASQTFEGELVSNEREETLHVAMRTGTLVSARKARTRQMDGAA